MSMLGKRPTHPLAAFEAHLLLVFRMDLQLHFFWSFFFTLLGAFWPPMIFSGIAVTIFKEALDWLADKGWSWGDFWFGIAGALTGFAFFHQLKIPHLSPWNLFELAVRLPWL